MNSPTKNMKVSKVPRSKQIRLRRTDQSMALLSEVIRKYHEEEQIPLTKIELRRKRIQAAVAMEEAASDIRA